MNDLVKIKKGSVTTNSRTLYEDTGKTHAHVVRDVEKIIKILTLQKRIVKNYFIRSSYTNTRNRKYKTYDMTRDGFSLLAMGYTKSKFMKFKLNFIDAFNKMEDEIKRISVLRQVSKETRKVLTEEVQESGENERMKGFGYSAYTKLAYKLAGIEYKKADNFRDSLTPEELKRVKNIESMMQSLIQSGKQYADIKKDLLGIFPVMKAIN